MIKIKTMMLGPVMTNTYLVADEHTKEAVVIDPAWDGHLILEEAENLGWDIRHIWVTHAHFDHMGGAGAVVDGLEDPPDVALHPSDRMLWKAKGGAPLFGVRFEASTKPTIIEAYPTPSVPNISSLIGIPMYATLPSIPANINMPVNFFWSLNILAISRIRIIVTIKLSKFVARKLGSPIFENSVL